MKVNRYIEISSCATCPYLIRETVGDEKWKCKKDMKVIINGDLKSIQAWCSLPNFPYVPDADKIKNKLNDAYSTGYEDGWSDCEDNFI